ncbi:MAG: dienelactone hydrolase family protein [Planctomycetota bacterium]
MKTRSLVMWIFCVVSAAHAEIVTESLTYEHDGVQLKGYLAYDNATDARRPGVLVVHEWWGHNDYAQLRARMLAEAGYVAFALDMYGEGVLAETPQDASALATPFYQDRSLMRSRARAGLDVLRAHERVDDSKLGAIGYCFGGTVVLELARSGAPIDATVSFHGGLSTDDPADAENITGSVLVCNGAADAFVPEEERTAFREEMENAGVDYQFIEYGGAVHTFTNPDADAIGMDNVAYDEKADRRSWRAMLALFDETLR